MGSTPTRGTERLRARSFPGQEPARRPTPPFYQESTQIEGGVRAGAEVFFGFIGIPQLSLEGSVGVFLSSSTGKVSSGGASTRFSSFVLSTSSVAQPWDIFRKDIAARYYF